MNVRMPTVTMTGRDNGQMTRKRIVISVAPSSRAASIRACGIERKNCRKRRMLKALIMVGAMSPMYESVHPSFTIRMYCGISTIWNGIIIVKRMRACISRRAEEAEPRERIPDHGTEQDHGPGRHPRDEQAVQESSSDRDLGEDQVVTLQGEVM